MKLRVRFSVALGLLVLAILYVNMLSHGEPVPVRRPLAEFPKEIGEWRGTPRFFPQGIYDVLKVDDSILREYVDRRGNVLWLYIGYYGSQKEGQIIHSPNNCLVGSGWQPVERSDVEIQIPDLPGSSLHARRMFIRKGRDEGLALYWYHMQGRSITSDYLAKLQLIYGAMRYNRTDGAFIQMQTAVQGGDVERAMETMQGFVQLLVPPLQQFLPL